MIKATLSGWFLLYLIVVNRESKVLKVIQEYLFQFLICLIGIIGILGAFYITDDRIFSAVSGISASLIASAIVAIGSLVLFRISNKRKAVSDIWAIDGIYELRQEANIPLNEYQDNVKNQIDIIAMGLNSWVNARNDKITYALKHGVRIRIITVHPNNQYLSAVDKRENKMDGATKQSVISLAEFIARYESMSNFEIKYYCDLPLDLYFRVDNHLFVGPYLHGKTSQQTITYEFSKGGKGFDYYTNYFEMLWNEESIPKVSFDGYTK